MSKTVNKLTRIWSPVAEAVIPRDYPSLRTKNILEKMGHIFCPGPFYFFVFDFIIKDVVYAYPKIESILGLSPQHTNLLTLFNRIHEEDQAFLQECEALSVNFLLNMIEASQASLYKVILQQRDETYRNSRKCSEDLETQLENRLFMI